MNGYIFLSKSFPIDNIQSLASAKNDTNYHLCVVSLTNNDHLLSLNSQNVQIDCITLFDIIQKPSVLRELILRNPNVFLVFQSFTYKQIITILSLSNLNIFGVNSIERHLINKMHTRMFSYLNILYKNELDIDSSLITHSRQYKYLSTTKSNLNLSK